MCIFLVFSDPEKMLSIFIFDFYPRKYLFLIICWCGFWSPPLIQWLDFYFVGRRLRALVLLTFFPVRKNLFQIRFSTFIRKCCNTVSLPLFLRTISPASTSDTAESNERYYLTKNLFVYLIIFYLIAISIRYRFPFEDP